MSDPIQRIKYLKERNKELKKETKNYRDNAIVPNDAYWKYVHPLYEEINRNQKEINEEQSKYIRNFLLNLANKLLLTQFVNWLANKIDKISSK